MKVLIVSHNVISQSDNMGKTLHAYFQDWKPEDLCQLYFHSEVPTTHLCEQYFQVTDVDMVKALCLRKPGRALTKADIREERADARTDTGTVAQIYQAGRKRTPLMMWGRNTLWALNAWKTRELDEWVKEQKPDVIFFASGDYVFAYRIVAYLARKFRLPVVVSVVDDFYFHRGDDSSPLAKWNTRVFRKTIERMMGSAGGAVYVHPAMQTAYDGAFETHGQTLYKAAEMFALKEPEAEQLRISYFGSLGLNRHEAMLEVGRSLKKLVPDGSVLLDVYSGETRPEILKDFTEENGVRFCGSVSAEEVERIQQESHILLLAESGDPALTERLRYSLSTKVPEYLASGRCMLAYGPKEAGSISYLLEEGGLCVATSPEELETRLGEVLFSAEQRQAYAEKQMALAKKNHTVERNSAIVRAVLEQAKG